MKKTMIMVLAVSITAAACASGDGGEGEGPSDSDLPPAASDSGGRIEDPQFTQETAVPEPGDAPLTSTDSQPLPSASDNAEAFAVADLALRLDVPPSAIAVVTVENVTWRDGSHGCPEPGMSYTQALTSGVRIGLEVDGTDYWYHGGADGTVRYCADPRPPLNESPDA